MIIYKGDKHNAPIIIGIGVATDIANTKFRQSTGTTISRLNNLQAMFEGISFNYKNNKLVVVL